MIGIKPRYVMGLVVSILLIGYGLWKLNDFFRPRVGPVGNGLSDTIVQFVWITFTVNMVVGVGGVGYFTYMLLRNK